MIEFRKAPINETKLLASLEVIKGRKDKDTNLPPFVVYHDVVRFHVSMHDATRMAEIKSLSQLSEAVHMKRKRQYRP